MPLGLVERNATHVHTIMTMLMRIITVIVQTPDTKLSQHHVFVQKQDQHDGHAMSVR